MAAALPERRPHRRVRDRPRARGVRAALLRPLAARLEDHAATSAPALETIATLEGEFDFVFIDADKEGYVDYYEAVVPRLAERGLIVADNTLWSGRVVDGEGADRRAFNEHVAADPRARAGAS